MFKVSKKFSESLSLVISVGFFIACVVCAIRLPVITKYIIDTRNTITPGFVSDNASLFVLVLAYLVLAVCVLADALLFKLLLRVSAGDVFTPKSVSLIRGISWCCYLVGLIFICLGFYFYLSFMVAFAAVFLGLCLRIVKNVIEEATEIKNDNDLTI